MIRYYINTALMLGIAWAIYGYCQNDFLLPIIGGGFLVLTLLIRINTYTTQFKIFQKLNLSTIIFFSSAVGWIWGSIFPAPEIAYSPFPEFVSAVQAASILGAILLWLQPFSTKNLYRLTFLSWLCVAVSINVPFTPFMLFLFCLFCVLSTSIIILHTTKKPPHKKQILIYFRDFIIYSAILIMTTTGLFYGISRSIVIVDQAFMSIIKNYIMSPHYTHFLDMSPLLSLEPPGRSAFDRRPVLEASMPKVSELYLKTQTFEKYQNGFWQETDEITKHPLPRELNKDFPTGKMTMFTSFKDIIPTPDGIIAAKGSALYSKSIEGILFTPDEQRTRIIEYSLSDKNMHFRTAFDKNQTQRYSAIPDDIKIPIKEISSSIVGNETDPYIKASLIRNFFLNNFQYSLYVDFSANNEGILNMIREQKPAYCSYFATAAALMLRAEGIPARVVAGFLTYEKINSKTNTFIARVNNAHAWVEIFLPKTDQQTGEYYYRWMKIDPTPSNSLRSTLRPKYAALREFLDKIWLSMLRFRADIENLDKEKLKVQSVLGLLLLFLLINIRKIIKTLLAFLKGQKRKALPQTIIPPFLKTVYQNYEHCLKMNFDEVRKSEDTDTDVVARLKNKESVSERALRDVQTFVAAYQSARFGEGEQDRLKGLLRKIKQHGKV